MINGNEGGRNGGGTPTEYAPVAGAWSGLGIALRLMDADAEPVIRELDWADTTHATFRCSLFPKRRPPADAEPVILALRRPSGLR